MVRIRYEWKCTTQDSSVQYRFPRPPVLFLKPSVFSAPAGYTAAKATPNFGMDIRKGGIECGVARLGKMGEKKEKSAFAGDLL